ncbi:MAG: DegT/DnrJ/EryC1/StrS family aminotransferase [Armatimonadetes bacterium]|jgi:dTDP-4-amino-4,6-dideoxygalactose transaminase|nr:DegT/DnrJ/EryC1/StrS family aminotransferase [Armatimonadota bacterium]
MSDLAIDGAQRVRSTPLPNVGDISGRTFGDEEIANLTEVIRSGKLFRFGGKFVEKFEQDFAAMLNVKHAVAVTSGTAAIHTALGALNCDIAKEMITTPITDMGTIAPIMFQNCIPIFADLEPEYFNLLPESIEAQITDKTAAIIVVHLFGQPANMDAILAIGKKYNIPVIEDCCQAYLAQYNGKLVGTMGDIGCFSLQQSKHIASGDGGIIVTNDDELARRARLFADKGWPRGGDVRQYVFLGINYRMNELTGAVASAQVGKVDNTVHSRRAVAKAMTEKLASIPGIVVPKVREGCEHSWWLYPFMIDENVFSVSPKEFAAAVSAEGVGVGHGYIGQPIYMGQILQEKATYGKSQCPFSCPHYGKELVYKPEDCPNALEILRRLLILPCNERFTESDIDDIYNAVAKVAKAYTK